MIFLQMLNYLIPVETLVDLNVGRYKKLKHTSRLQKNTIITFPALVLLILNARFDAIFQTHFFEVDIFETKMLIYFQKYFYKINNTLQSVSHRPRTDCTAMYKSCIEVI